MPILYSNRRIVNNSTEDFSSLAKERPMNRYIKITLVQRGISCRARLLDDEAPRTSTAVWDALPQEGQVYHGKYARNEIYNLVPAFAPEEPGPENTTITPIPRDVCYFSFSAT